jgi:MFS family permease
MEVFPPRERVRALGWWSFVGAGAPVLGVVAGGPVVEHFSWRWIFAVQAPLCIVAVILGGLLLPGRRPTSRPRFDLAGSVLITVSVSSAMLAINRASVWGWTSPLVLVFLVLFPLTGVGFVLAERRAESPMLPLRFLRMRNFVVPLVVQFFGNFVYMGSFLLTPLFLEDVLGFTATKAGLVVIARPLTFSIAAPLFGYVAVKLGERTNAIAGMTSIVLSMVVFSTVGPGTPTLVITAALALAGLGLGISNPSLNATVANSVPENYLGVASAAIGMMTTIGGVVGMETLRSFKSFRVAAGVAPATAYDQAYLFAGVLGLCALAAAFFVNRVAVDDEGAPFQALHAA